MFDVTAGWIFYNVLLQCGCACDSALAGGVGGATCTTLSVTAWRGGAGGS